MCKYCEASTPDKLYPGHKYRELLRMKHDSIDVDSEEVETMACIIPPTPISKKQHEEDGLTSNIEIYLADDHRRVHHMYIPIKYCPVCGRDLSNE